MPTIFDHASLPVSRPARYAEASFWLVCAAIICVWALVDTANLFSNAPAATSLSAVLLKHAGATALVVSLLALATTCSVAVAIALKRKPIAQPSASVLLITICGLRAIEMLANGPVTVVDANILGGLFLAAAVVYQGPFQLWWTVLMPLATLSAFAPLVWLEYFKGAQNKTLFLALIVPASAFVIGSVIIIIRELRLRATNNVKELRQLRSRGESSMQALRSMELDMKSLTAALSRTTTQIGGESVTTEFTAFDSGKVASETCSLNEIETVVRQVLDDARRLQTASKIRLTLTSPADGGSQPVAVRGDLSAIYLWLKSSVVASISGVGGFSGGVVRVSLQPSYSSISISVEDNGRGLGSGAHVTQKALEGLLSLTEIRNAVEESGGRFDLQARLGVGCRVTIELPRVDAFATVPRATNRSLTKSLTKPSLAKEI